MFVNQQKVRRKSIAWRNRTKLFGFCLNCTANATFEVRYNSQTDKLCRCDRIVDEGKPVFFECNMKSRSNFRVIISVRNISNQWGENCTFIFFFTGPNVTETLPVTLTISTPYIINKDFLNSTASLIGHPSTASSFIVANSTTLTYLRGKMRLVVFAMR